MKWAATLLGAVTVCAAAVTPVACSTSAGGPELRELGVFAGTAPGNEESIACVTLPVLPGSQVDARRTVHGEFEVVVNATPSGAEVHIRRGNAELAGSTSISADELAAGFSREISVPAPDGDYTVRLSSACRSKEDGSGGSRATGGSGGRVGDGGEMGGAGGGAGAGGSAAGSTSTGGTPAVLRVDSMSPETGPYGTEVSIAGAELRTGADDVSLVLGDDEALSLKPDSSPYVVSWDGSQIRFRFPFPLSGAVALETSTGSVPVGSFEPTWDPGPAADLPGSAKTVASISAAAGHIAAVLDTAPPTLVEFDGADWTTSVIDVTDVRLDSLRLYLSAGKLRGFVLSNADPPVIVALEPPSKGAGLVASPTTVKVTTNYAVAGGTDGAAVWFADANAWRRARPAATGWAIDKGPIADPKPTGSLHAAGASSDGALHIAWAEATGTFLDDTGTPFMQTLPAAASTFGAKEPAGSPVDDSVTSLRLEGRNDGLIVHYCGSNVDPFGLSGTSYQCYVALHPASGESVMLTQKESEKARYSFRSGTISAARCDDDLGVRSISDLVADEAATTPTTDDVEAWPCSPILAAELDPNGVERTILRAGSSLYSPRLR